ncbi:MAG: hypothetical protein ACU843_12490 [Gammaproteobacteria bacterium]
MGRGAAVCADRSVDASSKPAARTVFGFRSRGLLFLLFWLFLFDAVARGAEWREFFDRGTLDPSRWLPTRAGDFRDFSASVVDLAPRGQPDYRLRLYGDTRGTRADVLKFVGVRSTKRFGVFPDCRVSVDLDWNGQKNGSYLSAALILSPHATRSNPLQTPDWLKIEYAGLPPGKRVRVSIAQRHQGRVRTIFPEGWPHGLNKGREIVRVRIEVAMRNNRIVVKEDQRMQYESEEQSLFFDSAYVYLQLSSHSNYAGREVYFDNVLIDGPN